MTKKKTIISIVLYAVIFAALLITATFTDLQVSNILASGPLSEHTYITNFAFGAVFESVGSVPVYFMFAFALEIFFWSVVRKNKEGKPLMNLLAVALGVSTVIPNFILVKDCMDYILKHLFMTDDPSAYSSLGFIVGIEIFFAIIFAAIEIMAVNNFSDESIEKLVKFAFAVFITAALATITVELIKKPVGRIRYRAMNLDPENEIHGFGAFAKWFEINGSKWKELYPDHEAKLAEFGSTDAFKSFPSGHTCAAGATYYLIMLIPTLDIKKKWAKALLWICPIVFTATVAISRITVGAHFFSDVLVGGTIAFTWMIIVREILICKGSHIKALFGKN